MNIMVGYEDTIAARKALDLAISYAKIFSAKVYIITSLTGGGDDFEENLSCAEKTLESVQNQIVNDGIDFETRLLVRGLDPGNDLVKFAKEKNINQIIIGIKRKSKLGKLLFGSNAQYIILNAPCPVVTVT